MPAAILFVLSLFPGFGLVTLQIGLVLMLVDLALKWRHIRIENCTNLVLWPYILIAQFVLFFLINALIFEPWPGNRGHYQSIAIESWSATLLCLVFILIWLRVTPSASLKSAFLSWLPVGLLVVFAIASGLFMSGVQGTRISIASPNPLFPPLWYLVLAMLSFCWFPEMNQRAQILRIVIFICAGLMAVYGGARVALVCWLAAGVFLLGYLYVALPQKRGWVLAGAGLIGVALAMIFIADAMAGGLLLTRFAEFTSGMSREELLRTFPRMTIWPAAAQVISENWVWGVGQVNERMAIQHVTEFEYWYRAHQTYLSYLIAGGVFALISGLLLQLPVLVFLHRANAMAMFPAFIGLGLVLTLNCLTDSVMQSALSVQNYLVLTLFSFKAAGKL